MKMLSPLTLRKEYWRERCIRWKQRHDERTTYLGKVRRALLVVVLVNQVRLSKKCQYVSTDANRQRTYLCPEWAEANSLKHLPPCQILIEGLLPDMDLKLKLPERNGESRRYVWFKKGGQSIEFPSFNIDLEDIDMGVSYTTAINNKYSRLL